MILHLEMGGITRKLELHEGAQDGTYVIHLDGEVIEADARLLQPGVLSVILNGRAYRCIAAATIDGPTVSVNARQHAYAVSDPRSLKARRSRTDHFHGARPVKASMPGRVVRVLVEAGDTVEAQQSLLVIEAMKMQNELKAPKAGRVSELRVAAGEAVSSGQVLAVIE